MCLALLGEPTQEAIIGGIDTSYALYAFDADGCHRLIEMSGHRFVIAEWQPDDGVRLVCGSDYFRIVGGRYCQSGTTVKTPLKDDDLVAAGMEPGQLKSIFIGLCPAVAQKEGVVRIATSTGKLVSQLLLYG